MVLLLYRRKSDFSSEGESCKGTCRGGDYYGEEEGDHSFCNNRVFYFCSVLGLLFFFFFGVAVGGEW